MQVSQETGSVVQSFPSLLIRVLCLHTIPDQVSFLLQEENRPVGGFSLRGSLVSALEDNGVPTGKGQLWPHPPSCSPSNALLMMG